MPQFRPPRSPLSTGTVVRLAVVILGLIFLIAAARFVVELPDVMPGSAAGMLVLVFVGAVLLVGALWIGI